MQDAKTIVASDETGGVVDEGVANSLVLCHSAA